MNKQAEDYLPPLVDGVTQDGTLSVSNLSEYGATVRIRAYPRIGFDKLTMFWTMFIGGVPFTSTLPISIPVKPEETLVFTVPLIQVRSHISQLVTVGYFVSSWDENEYASPVLSFRVEE